MSFRRVFALTVLIALGSAHAQTDAPATPENQQVESAASPAPAEVPAQDNGDAQPAEVSAPTEAPAQDVDSAPSAETGDAEPAAVSAPAEAAAMPETPATPIVYGDAEAGATTAAVCAACHGADGNSSDKQYPKLAGQNEAYIARQLAAFKSGTRMNAIMLGFATMLSTEDMHNVGAYFASQTALPGVADEEFVARGQKLYRGGDVDLKVPACMACHGPDGRGMAGAAYPQLAGQWSDYISTTLTAWKDGTTWGDDTHAMIMPEIASRLSEADIAALSSYVEGLHTATAGQNTAAR